MTVIQTAMLCGRPRTAVRDAIFTEQTAAEGLDRPFTNAPSVPAPK
jgi:hypothetical protein